MIGSTSASTKPLRTREGELTVEEDLRKLADLFAEVLGEDSRRFEEVVQALRRGQLPAAEAAAHLRAVLRLQVSPVDLVDGYESAYGMELLASVRWVVDEEPAAATDLDLATRLVQAWTSRKGGMFTPEHIRAAWMTLRDRGWLPAPQG